MQFFRDTASLPAPFAGTVLTIGNFDGVHLGHQLLLKEAVRRARDRAGTSMLLTFDPPPAQVLGKGAVASLLTLEEKREVVAGLGVDVFVCETFTRALASMPPKAFVEEILEARLNPAEILVGYDFCFGKAREGNADFLRAHFGPQGRVVERFEAVQASARPGLAPEIVSSTRIRRLLAEGQVEEAAGLLGRPYFLEGLVVPGDARGRLLGFPTANLESPREALVPHGVYAVWARVGDRRVAAVTNIGRRPTFDGNLVTVETHLLDFQEDLYGKRLKIALVAWLRPERKFEGLEALKVQLAQDVLAARGRLQEGS